MFEKIITSITTYDFWLFYGTFLVLITVSLFLVMLIYTLLEEIVFNENMLIGFITLSYVLIILPSIHIVVTDYLGLTPPISTKKIIEKDKQSNIEKGTGITEVIESRIDNSEKDEDLYNKYKKLIESK